MVAKIFQYLLQIPSVMIDLFFCRSPGIEMFQTGFSQRVLNTVWASYRYNLLSKLRNTSMHLAF